jgi:hypothetical protein
LFELGKNMRYEVLIASVILLLVISIPFLQVQTVAAKHHDDKESSDEQTSDEQTSDQQSSDSGPSLTERICNAVQGNDVQILISLLPLAHVITAGQSMTASAIIGIAQNYCASHGF